MKLWVWVSHQYWNSTTLIHLYSVQDWFISTGCKEYEYNVDIKLITFEICLIHTSTHSDSYIWKNTYIYIYIYILIYSNDSNHSSKFPVQLLLHLQKTNNKKDKDSKYRQRHNLLLSIVVFVCESCLFCESKSITAAYC